MGLRDVRQQFVEQEARIIAAHRVVLVAAVHAIQRVGRRRSNTAVHDEHADHRRDRLGVDQIVENDGGVVLQAVLKDHDRRRLGAIELLRHVDPVLAPGPGIHLALIELRLGDLAGRSAGNTLHRRCWLRLAPPDARSAHRRPRRGREARQSRDQRAYVPNASAARVPSSTIAFRRNCTRLAAGGYARSSLGGRRKDGGDRARRSEQPRRRGHVEKLRAGEH